MLKSAVLLLSLLLLGGCAARGPESVPLEPGSVPLAFESDATTEAATVGLAEDEDEGLIETPVRLVKDASHELVQLADGILDRGLALLGTPYRWGGSSIRTGFDCSGFIGFLFREEAGIELPRTTREMIRMPAPRIARAELQPGDLIFFNDEGRGRVSHVGIYLGEQRFLHAANRRKGVRIDSLKNRYWGSSFLQAKRVLANPEA